VLGAVVPAYNVPGLEQPIIFSGPVLADIYMGKVKMWDDPALADLNKGVKLPNKPIIPVHRSDSSGTTFVFTDYLTRVSSEEWKKIGKGNTVKWPDLPAAKEGKGNEGVAGIINKTEGALGYLEMTFALENKIKYGPVQNRKGRPIIAVDISVQKAVPPVAQLPDDLRFSLVDSADERAYPITGTAYAIIYVNQPADKGTELVRFLRWAVGEGQQYSQHINYAQLPSDLRNVILKKLEKVEVGP
jgi:phosphate transport system substrate-binding protein